MSRSRARLTGAVYFLYFITAIVAVSMIGRTPGAYSVTANLIANALYVVLTLLLYQLFAPVSRKLALLAVAISLVGCVVQSVALFHVIPPQSSLPIFGLFNLTIGALIVRSTFLPRILGVLMALSGIGWLMVLSPALVQHIGTYIEITGVVAEGCLMLWLLVMGVDVRRWREQATAVR